MAAASSQFGPSVQRDATLTAWLRIAAAAAAQIGAEKDARAIEWMQAVEDDGGSPADALDRLRELPRVLSDDDLVELNAQVTLAAMLRGMAAAQPGASKEAALAIVHSSPFIPPSSLIIVANAASGLFAKLPFTEAIDGLAKRLGLIKWASSDRQFQEQPAFMSLDAANRSRAFTMAWVEDLDHLQQIHDELVKTIANGESLYDWRMKHVKEIAEGGYRSTGWEGSPLGEAHYQLVYHQNLGMAYTAGRVERGTQSGFKVVKILPTLSMSHRPEHDMYVGSMFRIDEQSMLPPWDFGCNHGWEWVFPEELEAAGIDPASLPLLRFDDSNQEFKWRPSAYMALSINPGQYTGAVKDIADDMSKA